MLIAPNNFTAKLEAVTKLLRKLTADLEKNDLTTDRELTGPISLWATVLTRAVERDAMLEELKVYGRDFRDADPIFEKEVSI